MSTRFFTNHGEQTLFKKFQGVFQSNSDRTVKITPAALADKLMQILRTYPLPQAGEAPVTAAARTLDTTPDIILSESFDK